MSFNEKNIQLAKTGFQNKCLFIFIDAYREMKTVGNFNTSWKENMITKVIVSHVKKSPLYSKWSLDILREYYLDDYQSENDDPDKNPRIDFRFSKWQNQKQFEYFIEAKNLCETDWIKEDGIKVSSSYQLKRYVAKGINHFLTGYYPSNGCLCGYILQGDTGKIIEIIENQSSQKLELTTPINNHKLVYKIENGIYILLNIFLEFNKK